MTRDQAVALIKARLKRPADTALNAQIVTELETVQQFVLEESGIIRPWFLLTENLTTVTEIGEPRVVIPTGFLDEYEDGALWILNPDSNEYERLTRGTFEELRLSDTLVQYRDDDGRGMPRAYSLDGNYFRLDPVPAAVYTLQILVYVKDDLPANGSDTNQWLTYAAELLTSEAGLVIAQGYLQDEAAAAFFEGRRKAALDRLQRQNEGRKHSNKDYRMQYVGSVS